LSAIQDSRYKNITTNITKLVTMPGGAEEHFYGLWGIFHGSKATINGAEPLARLLDKPDAPFAGSVVSIGTLCLEDCANLMPARALPSVLNGSAGEEYTIMPLAYDNPYLSRVRGVNDLKAVMGDDTLDMFRLSGDASPYHYGPRLTESSGILALMQPFHYGASAADVLDYVVAIRTSKPLTPWKGKAAEAPI